ncbi:hypothetical protein, partial [Vibrio atlanticus]
GVHQSPKGITVRYTDVNGRQSILVVVTSSIPTTFDSNQTQVHIIDLTKTIERKTYEISNINNHSAILTSLSEA